MTARPVTVFSAETVAVAVARMTQFGFSALPVVTSSFRLIGIVSLIDVLQYRQDCADQGVPAHDGAVAVDEIMTADVLTMAATANVSTVADRLRRYGELRVLPIVDGGRLVGVVTRGDLLRRLLLPEPPERRTPRRGLFGMLGWATDDDTVDPLPGLAAHRRRRSTAVPEASVRDVMTTDVVTVGPHDPVQTAAARMLRGRHSALPVVDAGGLLLGVLSEADLLAEANVWSTGLATSGGAMTSPAITVPVDATVAQARALLVDKGLRTLPVVDGARLVGVLGRSDLV